MASLRNFITWRTATLSIFIEAKLIFRTQDCCQVIARPSGTSTKYTLFIRLLGGKQSKTDRIGKGEGSRQHTAPERRAEQTLCGYIRKRNRLSRSAHNSLPIGSDSNFSITGYIFRLGQAGVQPSKALKHSRSPPVNAVQKLFFEPVKDRWGIRELF